jgi:hypothetical protein
MRPASGAASAPPAPASANSAMPFWLNPNNGPLSTSGTPVQNMLNVMNSIA